MKQLFFMLVALLILTACTISPSKIEFGTDVCNYCDMTIVDRTHAAQVVTNKGKVYKYDAIECLINDIAEKEENSFAYLLVTDFSSPEKLVNATKVTYLISEEIKSPMGANLSAFPNKDKAISFKGKLFNWEEIKQKIRN